jgi:hypothetical protein
MRKIVLISLLSIFLIQCNQSSYQVVQDEELNEILGVPKDQKMVFVPVIFKIKEGSAIFNVYENGLVTLQEENYHQKEVFKFPAEDQYLTVDNNWRGRLKILKKDAEVTFQVRTVHLKRDNKELGNILFYSDGTVEYFPKKNQRN